MISMLVVEIVQMVSTSLCVCVVFPLVSLHVKLLWFGRNVVALIANVRSQQRSLDMISPASTHVV